MPEQVAFESTAMDKTTRIAAAVRRLVEHQLGGSQSTTGQRPARVEQTFQYCMGLLGSLLEPSAVRDEFSITEAIKREGEAVCVCVCLRAAAYRF